MMRRSGLLSFILLLSLPLPAIGGFETVEESDRTLIVRFTLGLSLIHI